MKKKQKHKRFTEYEDDIIKSFVKDDEEQCVIECLRKAGKALGRTLSEVKNRYYRKRGEWEPLFIYAGRHTRANTKNCGGRGKGRSDLFVKGNSVQLKYQTVVLSLNFKL